MLTTNADTANSHAASLRLKTFIRSKIDGYSPAAGKRRFIRSAVGGDERDEAAANKYSSLLRDVEVAVAPVEGLERTIREQDDEIQALYSQNRGLTETNRNLGGEVQRLKEKNQALMEQVQHLSDENPVLSDKIVELKEELQSMMDRNRALTEENGRLNDGVENLKNETHRLADDLDQLKDQKLTLETDNSGMKTQLRVLITGIISLHSAIPKGQSFV
jgi:chromosome segregation ATPase